MLLTLLVLMMRDAFIKQGELRQDTSGSNIGVFVPVFEDHFEKCGDIANCQNLSPTV